MSCAEGLAFPISREQVLFNTVFHAIDKECNECTVTKFEENGAVVTKQIRLGFPQPVCQLVLEYMRVHNPFEWFVSQIPYDQDLSEQEVAHIRKELNVLVAAVTASVFHNVPPSFSSNSISSKFFLPMACVLLRDRVMSTWFCNGSLPLRDKLCAETFQFFSFSLQPVAMEIDLSSPRQDIGALLSSIPRVDLEITWVSATRECTQRIISICSLNNISSVKISRRGTLSETAHSTLQALAQKGVPYVKGAEIRVVPDSEGGAEVIKSGYKRLRMQN